MDFKGCEFYQRQGKGLFLLCMWGGSTMGYKLAGYDVIGCNEIDKRMNDVYVANHHPKFNFNCDIKELLTMDLPQDLYELDVLDGSPPCSSFSMAGNREKDWGKKKKFKEGQAAQILDTLFFDFIALAKRLQPKVVIAENVKGILSGEAIQYVRKIYDDFEDAGYVCQHFLLNSSLMGVPQRRERVFFVCLRKDLADQFMTGDSFFFNTPELNLEFNESEITMSEFVDHKGKGLSPLMTKLWENRLPTDKSICDASERMRGKKSMFNLLYVHEDDVCPTLPAREACLIHYETGTWLSRDEACCIQTFPLDYDFLKQSPHYICGMSVPPVMMAQVASRVWEQWLSKL